jgi:hypothetical protein
MHGGVAASSYSSRMELNVNVTLGAVIKKSNVVRHRRQLHARVATTAVVVTASVCQQRSLSLDHVSRVSRDAIPSSQANTVFQTHVENRFRMRQRKFEDAYTGTRGLRVRWILEKVTVGNATIHPGCRARCRYEPVVTVPDQDAKLMWLLYCTCTIYR